MAKDMISYDKIQKIAKMSVDEYRKAYVNEGLLGIPWLFGDNVSDEEIQAVIDRYKDAVDSSSEYTKKWSSLIDTAEQSYDEMYKNSLAYLEASSGITKEQWDYAYDASVSDNYATGDMDGVNLDNITIPAGDDNIEIDWSELQAMKKTKLSNGSFKEYTPSDNFDDSSEIGETRNICGGTVTYLGKKNVTYDRGDTVSLIKRFGAAGAWKMPLLGDMVDFFDQRTNMVHYEGVLGSFDYDANEFSLGYWEQDVNGTKVRVPCLHYINDGAQESLGGFSFNGFLDGEHIKIPEGLKSMDYMFADTGIITMPEIPDSVESAHCAFMDCKQLVDGCDSAKKDSGINKGHLKTLSNLTDTSWMFAGCEDMVNYFPTMSESTVDARYMYAECSSLGWDGLTINDEGEMENSVKLPNLSSMRYANLFWLQNMFDGCDDAIIEKCAEYLGVTKEDFKEGNIEGISEWTDEDGVHHNRYDRLQDNSYNKDLEQEITDATARGKILRMIDKDGKGLTGVASDTGNLASYGVQTTETGTLADDSVWAKFRQSDFSETFNTNNEFGEILNRAIPAVGTYAVAKSVLNKATEGKHKGIATIGAIAVAAVPQIVGFGNTLTPVLDWTANAVGPGTKVGTFLTGLSDKLKGNVTYHTAVSELNVDKTFEGVQDSAVKLAANQVGQQLMLKTQYDGDSSMLIATRFKFDENMRSNGKILAHDANLLFIACEPEENLKNTLSDSIMSTSLEALRDKMDQELTAAGNDADAIKAVRDKYSGQYMTLLSNLNEYDDAALTELESVYTSDPELKAQAMNGLEKVMRCTAKPLYEQMAELQTEFQEKYGIDFLSDKQLNDSEESTKSMGITGLGTFNDFDPNKNYSDQSDVYVEKLEVYQKALVEAVQNASSQEEIDAAYASYYETAYGWALDEAEAHGVILDKRGAQTSAEKDSFAEYIAKVESETQADIKNAVTNSENQQNDSNNPSSGTETASAENHAASVAAFKNSDLPEIAKVLPDGVIFDAEYYAKTNPDVVQAVGNDFNNLYTHYIAFGVEEGRAAYEGDSGQKLPADYTEDVINEYKESFGSTCEAYTAEQIEKASERAAMVGISDADTEAAEKAAIDELNM